MSISLTSLQSLWMRWQLHVFLSAISMIMVKGLLLFNPLIVGLLPTFLKASMTSKNIFERMKGNSHWNTVWTEYRVVNRPVQVIFVIAVLVVSAECRESQLLFALQSNKSACRISDTLALNKRYSYHHMYVLFAILAQICPNDVSIVGGRVNCNIDILQFCWTLLVNDGAFLIM